MATATKEKNGKVTVETVADVADQFTQEAKAVTDSWLDAANKAAEEGKVAWEAQQKVFQDNFALWQEYSKNHFDFVIGANQQMVEAVLAAHENWFDLSASNLTKAQKLSKAEQELVLEAVEAFWAQTQAASQRMAKMVNFVPGK